MPPLLTQDDLQAAVAEARELAERRPARAASLAMALRWTGDEAGAAASARIAAERAEAAAERAGGWSKLAQAGEAWRLAGEEERAARCEARARAEVAEDPLADPGAAAALAYWVGDLDAARAPAPRPSQWTRIVGAVADARAGADPQGAARAREELVALIREGGHTPASGGLAPLGLWPWLEEAARADAAARGAEPPTPADVLRDTGLIG